MQSYARSARRTKHTPISWHCAFHTHPYPYSVPQNTFGSNFGAEVYAFGRPHHTHICIGIVRPYYISKGTFSGDLGAELRAFRTPHQKRTFTGSVRFNHIYTTYPKTPNSGPKVGALHQERTFLLVVCISNTLILGTQNHFWWQILVQKCARSLRHTTDTHLWALCISNTHPYCVSKYTFVADFGAELCALGVPHQKHTFLALCFSNTPVLDIKRCLRWCRGVRTGHTTP